MKTYNRTFRAKIVDDFYEAYLKHVMRDEKVSLEKAKEYYGGKELSDFARTVRGKVVTLIETAYVDDGTFHGTDCVEPQDNNWIIPAALYEEVAV